MNEKMLESLQTEPGMLMMRMEVLMDKHVLAPIGLNTITFRILMVLRSKEIVYQQEIADYVSTTPANISRRLEIMKKEGLIERDVEGDKKDRRKVIIKTTAEGKKKFMDAAQRMGAVHEYIKSKFSKKEREAREKFHRKFKEALDELETKIETFYL